LKAVGLVLRDDLLLSMRPHPEEARIVFLGAVSKDATKNERIV